MPEGGAAIACDGAARPSALRTHNVTERAKVELVVRPHLCSPTHVLVNLRVAKQAWNLDDRLCTRKPSPPSVNVIMAIADAVHCSAAAAGVPSCCWRPRSRGPRVRLACNGYVEGAAAWMCDSLVAIEL